MNNKIIIGITQALDNEFNSVNDDYTIYTESIEQGFTSPCFLVKMLNSNSKQTIGTRYKREHYFDIHYFPKDESNVEINDITERLFTALEYITVNNDLVRGSNMSAEIVDSVLHFFINFNMAIIKETTKEEVIQGMNFTCKIGE